MKAPCCSVCETKYNEKERVPLLLQCGHCFCKDCLSKLFSSSPDTSLLCPRCRNKSVVGNSVNALRKNYALLSLILSDASPAAAANSNHHHHHHNLNSNFDSDATDEDDDDEREEEDMENNNSNNGGSYEDGDVAGRRSRGSHASSSGLCGPVIEVGVHSEVKLVRKIGEGRRAGVEVWAAYIGAQRRCRHKVAVKRVAIGEEMEVEWVTAQLESLRRASMWCRNVCTFHGVSMRMEGSLGLVMDRCYGSVQSAMQRNEGRLTLEQILRFHWFFVSSFNLILCALLMFGFV